MEACPSTEGINYLKLNHKEIKIIWRCMDWALVKKELLYRKNTLQRVSSTCMLHTYEMRGKKISQNNGMKVNGNLCTLTKLR